MYLQLKRTPTRFLGGQRTGVLADQKGSAMTDSEASSTDRPSAQFDEKDALAEVERRLKANRTAGTDPTLHAMNLGIDRALTIVRQVRDGRTLLPGPERGGDGR